jgi:hypothetical protein
MAWSNCSFVKPGPKRMAISTQLSSRSPAPVGRSNVKTAFPSSPSDIARSRSSKSLMARSGSDCFLYMPGVFCVFASTIGHSGAQSKVSSLISDQPIVLCGNEALCCNRAHLLSPRGPTRWPCHACLTRFLPHFESLPHQTPCLLELLWPT